MALLGSNHARNNAAAQDAKDWADTIRPFLLRIVAQCQEKPIDEAFPVFSAHATVVVDVAFQVSEDSLEFVVRVGHAINQPPGEQIWQVEADAGQSRAQPPVCVVCLSCVGAGGTLFQEICPFHGPGLEGHGETVPVAGCQRSHQRLQFTTRRKAWVPRELSSYDGAHVVLAHLHLVALEDREECLHPVDDNAVNHIAATLDPGNGLGIICGAFMSNMLQVQRLSAHGIKCHQNATIAAEIGRVKLDHAMSSAHGIAPCDADIAQDTLHC